MRTKLLLLFLLMNALHSFSQTALQTSFESPVYTAGNVNAQNGWTVSSGTAVITTAKAKTGTQSLNLSATAGTLLVNQVAYSGSVPGITGDVYADCWVNPGSFATKGIAINGMDLWGGSSKRIFVIEFGTDGSIKGYNSGSGVNVGTWAANSWVRISIKVDFATEKYKVAVNGNVNATDFAFREAYTPAASGTRAANVKEFHSLRFNHLADATVATSDAAFDDIYVGTASIPDISFGASATTRTITVTQPAFGSIGLSPAAPYNAGQQVTATLTLPQGYINNGWTGDLSGTEPVKIFTLNNNMTIGADVGIDNNNPPPKYLVNVTQPANGTITLSPASADNMYYKETSVTATVSYEACYQFDGWTGGLSGTQLTKTFTVTDNIVIGAVISLNTTVPVKRSVNNVTAFKAALAAMNPGDTVEVEDGSYNLSSLTITRSGCELQPIVITAKNKGQVILNGATALVFRNMKYVTLKGFSFQSTGIGSGIKLENCSKFRITENEFAYTETSSCTWITIGDTYASPIPLRSGYNRVDHNSFSGKTQAGNYIRMDGNINQQTQYDTIDHNHFKNNGPRADNEKESIRVGVSTLSKSSGFTLIEYNLFEDCDGDPEIVSIKSCDNTVRYNTFVRCLGTVCLRQGFRSTVEGNYFFGDNKTATFNGGTIGCGGVRVYAKDHHVINNYFSGLTGSKWDAAITITNGDVTNSSTSVADHYLPENLKVAFNTFVNNKSDIEIGFDNNGNYPLKPVNCSIENNVVVQNTNPIIKSYSAASLAGVTFNNNIMYPTGSATVGITATATAINVIDPKLAAPICTAPANCLQSNASKVLRLSFGSPAIDAASGTYANVLLDNERQARTSAKDIGADEYSSTWPLTVNVTALDADNVGPSAVSQTYTYILTGALPLKILQFKAAKEQQQTKLVWTTSGEINEDRYEVEWSADGNSFTKIGSVGAVGNSALQVYTFYDAAHLKGKSQYRLKIFTKDGRYTYSSICTIGYGASIQAYPNPVTDKLTINLDRPATIELFAADGRKVKTLSARQGGTIQIELKGIAAGIYLLRIHEGNELLLTQKMIMQ
ncbi:chondroitinase-B domain-containing protein [Ferruginibacter sp. HRS2-29]|uniref:chondroitinase-B domain-containing protein n=1 Tax=Ferruginibacter sp. HRS2-29 TaxID=2487334 RepID=UPI0020CCD966|nr:chondroitinase-B domain-containing protein [Ferruginibacter sp. HRS2-29]MCP9750063.1 T9SS C-terminal target domain-containing protein [Ferruginibacter sp. HRS2-29]